MQGDGDAGSTAGYIKWEADPAADGAGVTAPPQSTPLSTPPHAAPSTFADPHGAAADEPVIDVAGARPPRNGTIPNRAAPNGSVRNGANQTGDGDAFIVGLRRDLERIGIEAVEWADAASEALRAEAEQEAAQIQADAARRADRLLREVDRARIALRSEARLAAARIWDAGRNPDTSLTETLRRVDSAFTFPPRSGRSDDPTRGLAPPPATAEPPTVLDDGEPPTGTLDPIAPPVPRFHDMLREVQAPTPPPPTVSPPAGATAPVAPADPLTAAPTAERTVDVAAEPETAEPETAEPETAEPETAEPETAELETAELETAQLKTAQLKTAQLKTADTLSATPVATPATEPARRGRRRWTSWVIAALVVVLGSAAVAVLLTRSDDNKGPRLVPTTTVSPAAATANTEQMYNRFSEQFASLAPVGGAVIQQGPLADQEAATGRADQLQQALATGRTAGYSGGFSDAPGGDGKPSEGREVANASFSRYGTPDDASAAFDAVRDFTLGGSRTSDANVEVQLPANLALRAFAYRSGTGPSATYSAVLEFPAAVVQLSTTGLSRAALDSMVAVTSSWAR